MSAPAPLASDETLHCARHPGTETVLRCGRCFTPICPKCMVSTAVGARCPTCAQVNRKRLVLKPRELARATAFGVGAAALGTVLVSVVPLPGGFFSLLLYALLGYCVGESVASGANRKRAPELGPVAVGCLLVGYELGVIILLAATHAPMILALAVPSLMRIVGLFVGALLAWMRVR